MKPFLAPALAAAAATGAVITGATAPTDAATVTCAWRGGRAWKTC